MARASLSILDEHELVDLHNSSLQILSDVGVRIPHTDMRSLFMDAGAEVENDAQVVKIPETLVMGCLEKAGRSYTLFGRDRQKQVAVGVGSRHYATSAGQASWVEEPGTVRRYATVTDIADAARLADGLPWIGLVGAMADPHEVPVEFRCVRVAAELIKHTTKPILLWFHDRRSCRYILEILSAVAGSVEEATRFPLTFPTLEPISPLSFPFHGIDLLFETARFSLPVPVGPMAQIGATAPGTLAGTLAQENAEILAGICVTQLIRPGLPVLYAGLPHAFDMRTTQLVFSGPEQALMAIAMAQLGRHYDLPVCVNVGLTDSKLVDAQAGLEAGMTLVCGAMAGAEAFGSFGICGVDQGASLPMLVMQNELAGYVERIMRGFEVSREAVGMDVVRSVGPGGHYLATQHTRDHFRRELWFPTILDRHYWPRWFEGGAQSMQDRCIDMKERILREHLPVPLDDALAKELDRIVAAARSDLVQG